MEKPCEYSPFLKRLDSLVSNFENNNPLQPTLKIYVSKKKIKSNQVSPIKRRIDNFLEGLPAICECEYNFNEITDIITCLTDDFDLEESFKAYDKSRSREDLTVLYRDLCEVTSQMVNLKQEIERAKEEYSLI